MTRHISDEVAMEKIHMLLDGEEWSPDTVMWIAQVVEFTGREINDCNEVEES